MDQRKKIRRKQERKLIRQGNFVSKKVYIIDKCCFKGLKGSEIFVKTGTLLELCKNLKRLTINSKKNNVNKQCFFESIDSPDEQW
ncbi:unnamed protein product [Paramecium primaurelia]|uniref:Uncharacterized protein n=1 Tax=Paramecium primaurelia TaxID=5886 RepID=A0A8S1NTD2_PARPR|nr:unnamed protein product [Paramecium primaurelia]